MGNTDSVELRCLVPVPKHDSLRQQTAHFEPEYTETFGLKPRARQQPSYSKGWRFGATNCAISACVTFIINLVVTIVWGMRAQSGVLFEGDCDKAAQINSGIHILINALSTVLLGSSNYTMQCLSAPTRDEVDQAHVRGKWLDIGVPSARNLKHIRKWRVLLWLLLGLSSLPLHLFYNSVVFGSIASNDYAIYAVGQSFIDDPECSNCGNMTGAWVGTEGTLRSMHERAREGSLDRLSNTECIDAYAQMFQTKRRNLLLVASDEAFPPVDENPFANGTHVFWGGGFSAGGATDALAAPDIYDWICNSQAVIPNGTWTPQPGPPCVDLIGDIKDNSNNWTVRTFRFTNAPGYNDSSLDLPNYLYNRIETLEMKRPIEYCLSEKAVPHCKVRWSVPIAVVVTSLNLFKAILILYTAFCIKEEPLMTMGDAVASFIEQKDTTTTGMCLLSIKDVRAHKGYFHADPKRWTGKKYRWKDVTSKKRRLATFFMHAAALITISLLLNRGFKGMADTQSKSIPALAQLGFGTVDPRAVIAYVVPGNILNVLIANSPQPILSFLYFLYNGMFSCMLLGYEWSTYGHSRKGLRVSRAPSGAQRSTYFLSLPYRFALPLMALSGLLHWLVSQSIFVISIDIYDINGSRPPDLWTREWTSIGFSPIAIITVLFGGVLMMLAGIGFGFVPLKPGMEPVGSCSAAMSAACHMGPSEGSEAALMKLKWGVVIVGADYIGHCAFSSKDVEAPQQGVMYAGMKKHQERCPEGQTTALR